jgi:hypothetical protein
LYNSAGEIADHSEDCLFLNVFSPNVDLKQSSELKPEMFWIHGGALEFGTASSPEYYGCRIAANQDVIVVTINYGTNGVNMNRCFIPHLLTWIQFLDFQLARRFQHLKEILGCLINA